MKRIFSFMAAAFFCGFLCFQFPVNAESVDSNGKTAKSKLPVPVQKLLSQMVYVNGGEYFADWEWIHDSSEREETYDWEDFSDDEYGYEQIRLREEKRRNECRRIMKDFYASRYEVNRDVFKFVTGIQKDCWKVSGEKIDMTMPANGISWYEAIDFCNKISVICGLKKCYEINGKNVVFDENADGFRLPSEDEWEWMGRGGKGDKDESNSYFAFYGRRKNDLYLKELACVDGTLHQCGTKRSNELGIYDLSGNLWEWCWNGDKSNRRIMGGSYSSDRKCFEIGMKSGSIPEKQNPDFGFRVVKNK